MEIYQRILTNLPTISIQELDSNNEGHYVLSFSNGSLQINFQFFKRMMEIHRRYGEDIEFKRMIIYLSLCLVHTFTVKYFEELLFQFNLHDGNSVQLSNYLEADFMGGTSMLLITSSQHWNDIRCTMIRKLCIKTHQGIHPISEKEIVQMYTKELGIDRTISLHNICPSTMEELFDLKFKF